MKNSDEKKERRALLGRLWSPNYPSVPPFLQKNAPPIDLFLLLSVLALALFGTAMVFSAGYAYADFRYDDSAYFMKRQTVFLAIGIAGMLIFSRVSVSFIERITPILYAITLALLILVLMIGLVGNGAKRWISLGPITIQPSEIAKVTMVLMMARYFVAYEPLALEKKNRRHIFLYGTLFPMVIMLSVILPVMLQKHLSCIIILGLIGVSLLVMSGSDTRYLRFFALLGVIGVTSLALFTDYTKDRITVWLDPEAYQLTGGWQTLQGLMAIGSGGIFGLGYGKSLLKYCYISEPANDMIFTVLCEELGFLGAMLAMLLFALLIYRGYHIALRTRDTFARLTALGIVTKIAIQVLLNIAVVTNTIPNTGISLPFFSYGGSSLVMLFLEMGILLSISRDATISK
ncbi:MAG: cell division protein FtsW [Clostridia bacterium]|nr:cell division protein FtsW [Clostridia bacterium]